MKKQALTLTFALIISLLSSITMAAEPKGKEARPAPKAEAITLTGTLKKTETERTDKKTQKTTKVVVYTLVGADEKVTTIMLALGKDAEKPDLDALVEKNITIKGEGITMGKGDKVMVKITKIESCGETAGGDAPAGDVEIE